MSEDDPFGRYRQQLALEWDENKRRANIDKHGIDFLDAPEVFNDPAQYTFRSKHPKDEIRYVTVGAIKSRVVVIVSTVRGQRLRIISMRAARKNERDRYG